MAERRFGKGEFSLALDQSDGMHYTKLVNQLPYFYGFSTIREPEFQIRDINGDGIIDFVIEENGCGFGTCYSVFHVITGYPDGFHLIESTAISGDDYGLLGTYWSEANWSISQENFLPSLEITKYRDMSPWDCITSSTKTYQWIGKTEHVVEYPITHPDTGICYIARAMDVQESLDRIFSPERNPGT